MLGDAAGYRYDPAHVTIASGGAVRWVLISGAPHDVAFDAAAIPDAGRAPLAATMPSQRFALASPYLTEVGETYTVPFTEAPPGTYPYYCTPHCMMGMVGSMTVR